LQFFDLKVQNLLGGTVINIPSTGSSQTVDLNPLATGNYFLVAERNGNSDLELQLLVSR